MFDKMKPLGDKVLVKRQEHESKTAGGIIIPDAAKEKAQHGTVIAVGPGGKDKQGKVIPLEVKPGDKVLFTKYGPAEIKIDNKEYLIAKEEDILAILE